MSDKETAPWMKEAAESIALAALRYRTFQMPTRIAEIIAAHCPVAVECTAPAPQPAFTPEEVDCLNEYQLAGIMHPFTCVCGCDLVATVRGWICCKCDYTQNWAHDWMKNRRWKRREATPQVTPTDARIQAFWNAQAEWSRATFGSDEERDHIGPLKHLAKEAVEAQVRPADRTEIADCQFLVFDAARRSGMTLAELFDVCDQKLIVNKARKWSRPTSDNPVEHVREGTSEQASPTPDKCPTCKSDDPKFPYIQRFGAMDGPKCTDPWHSSAGTPTRNTGVSLDGGKTIHSKLEND